MRKSELFDAYLSDSLTAEQAEELKKVLKTEKGSDEFMQYITESNLMCDILEKQSEINQVQEEKKKSPLIPFIISTAIAASLAIFMLIKSPSESPVTVTIIEKGVKKEVLLTKPKIYKSAEVNSLVLSDGTAINSRGSGLITIENENNVSIENGLYSFEVTPRSEQNRFRIQMTHGSIEVIGTAFEIIDSQEHSSIVVTEGIVSFVHNSKVLILKAGDSATANSIGLSLKNTQLEDKLELSIDGKYTDNKAAFRDVSSKQRTGWASWDTGHDGAVKQISDQGNEAIAFTKSGRLGIEKFILDGPFTLSCWVKPNGNTKEFQTMLSNGNSSWRMSLDKSSQKALFSINGMTPESLSSKTTVQPNTWQLITAVYDGGNLKLYINGLLDNFKPVTGTILQYKGNIEVGGNHEAWNRNFEGALDGVQVYSRDLSDLEILKLFQNGRP